MRHAAGERHRHRDAATGHGGHGTRADPYRGRHRAVIAAAAAGMATPGCIEICGGQDAPFSPYGCRKGLHTPDEMGEARRGQPERFAMGFSTSDLTLLRIRCAGCKQYTERLVTLLVRKTSMTC